MSEPKSCTCDYCVQCCKTRPGWMRPKQFREIAAFLGLGLREAFEAHFMIDWWVNYKSKGDALLIAPAIVGYEGKYAPNHPYGRCVFLDEHDRCKIHPVKPIECAEVVHDVEDGFGYRDRYKLASMWQRKTAQKMIMTVLGR